MLDASLLPIQDDQVRLRPLVPEDAELFAEGTTDVDVRTYAHLPEPHYTPESVRALITGPAQRGLQTGQLAMIAIADASTDSFAGSLVIFDVEGHRAEVGFWLHPNHRGAGRSQAALNLAAQFAQRSGISHLAARTSVDNLAAQRVLSQGGFVEHERRRDTAPSGVSLDMVHYTRNVAPLPALPLTTQRLVLRAHQDDDARWLQRIYSQPQVARYLLEEPWTTEDARRQIEQRLPRTDLDGPTGALGLVIEHQQVPVGDVALWLTDREHRMAEIGWVLDPEQQGRGLAAEAVRAVLDLAFDHYRLHRVCAQMDARNVGSARLSTSVGMQQEAHLRQDWWSKGEWTDSLIYAMLASDRC